MARPRIVVVGVASLGMALDVDEFPIASGRTQFPEWMSVGVSGVGANVAKALSTLGAQVELCTVVGADATGELIRADLGAHGLLGPGVVEGAGSSLALSLSADDGQRRNFAVHRPVNEFGYPVEVFEELICGADLLVFTTAAFTRALLEPAHRAGVAMAVDAQVIVDVNDPKRAAWLDVADIVFCSHEQLPCSPTRWIEQMFATYPGCQIAAVGCGAEGALVGAADGTLVHAVTEAPRPIASPVGAGDTLFASFLHTWLSVGNPVQAVAEAVLHAAYKIGDRFPAEGHLTHGELESLRQHHPVEVDLQRWK